jgi:PAS domain S-box-containing protein
MMENKQAGTLNDIANALLHYSSDIVICLAKDYTITLLNPTAEQCYNWTFEEIRGKNFVALCKSFNYNCPISAHYFDNSALISLNSNCKNNLGKEYNINWVIYPMGSDAALLIGTVHKTIAYHFDGIIDSIPGCLFWKDCEGHYLGCNSLTAKLAGLASPYDVVGKTDRELWGDSAERMIMNDEQVIMQGSTVPVEEELITASGQQMYFTGVKMPLKDENNHIIGIIGNALDITELKETQKKLVYAKKKAESAVQAMVKAEAKEQKHRAKVEQLKIENITHKAQLEAQEQFTKIANQVVHDIRSPLSSLKSILKACTELPEKKRIDLRMASIRIEDIANHLLNQYTSKKTETCDQTEEPQPVLLSATLLELVSEKKFEYENRAIQFESFFNEASQFVFIQVQLSSLKRMMSNLINNAVDAFDGREGIVTLKLEANHEWVRVIVQDNGKGMSPELINKINQNISVTEGKEGGHGIGLTQVRDTLEHNYGSMTIDSTLGAGTQIILEFPRISAPGWCAEKIQLGRQDIVVILDDDPSIHGAWDVCFESILKQAPDIHLHHFEEAQKALDFIGQLSADEKKKIFLLTDYELLKQELNGLNVIEQSHVPRSILVTSHYVNTEICKQAVVLRTKILPKQLASEIPICIDETLNHSNEVQQQGNQQIKIVDAVIVDDDKQFIQNFIEYELEKTDVVDYFNSPEDLKAHLSIYPKNTRIYLDQNFTLSNSKMNGITFSAELHALGYSRLYLISGDTFQPGAVPDYLMVIPKGDITLIKADW